MAKFNVFLDGRFNIVVNATDEKTARQLAADKVHRIVTEEGSWNWFDASSVESVVNPGEKHQYTEIDEHGDEI